MLIESSDDFRGQRCEGRTGAVGRPLGKRTVTRLGPAVALLLLTGCGGGLLDDIEDEAYDAAARKLSAFCELNRGSDLFWQRTRIEVRREIRQRGTSGPPGPDPIPPGLDERTANGRGPVLMIWCVEETNGQDVPFPVPDPVWRNMIRDWVD